MFLIGRRCALVTPTHLVVAVSLNASAGSLLLVYRFILSSMYVL